MVAMYNVFGRQVGSHWLAIATLGTLFGGVGFMRAGGSAQQPKTPPINAGSKDEENFIQEFIQSIEKEDQKSKGEAKH